MTKASTSVCIVEETPAYWRVLFDNPPLNVVDSSVFEGLQELLSRIDASSGLRVVVFESANPEFYLAHFDMTGKSAGVARTVGPSGLPTPMDAFVRLTTSPVVSIAKIRGRVRGVGSEFVLACDMRFASREKAISGSTGNRCRGDSRWRWNRAPAIAGRARPRARNHSRCRRLRWRYCRTVRLRQPGTSGR